MRWANSPQSIRGARSYAQGLLRQSQLKGPLSSWWLIGGPVVLWVDLVAAVIGDRLKNTCVLKLSGNNQVLNKRMLLHPSWVQVRSVQSDEQFLAPGFINGQGNPDESVPISSVENSPANNDFISSHRATFNPRAILKFWFCGQRSRRKSRRDAIAGSRAIMMSVTENRL